MKSNTAPHITAAKRFHSILPKRPIIWATLWITWVLALWLLSEGAPVKDSPKIPHLDKVLHFTYFGIGGSLLAGYLTLVSRRFSVFQIIILAWIMGATIGALDEYHQSFNPDRNGNNLFDWCADHLGALCGAILCLWIFHTSRK